MKLLTIAITFLFLSTAFAETKIKMNFKEEEILKIIETYSKASGQKFVIDPGVRGKISIFIQEPVSLEEAFNQLSSALAINGFAISKKEDTMIVKSARNIQRDLLEVSAEVPTLKPERMYTWVYTFKNVAAIQVNRELRILPSKDGEMNVYEPNNQIIITDYTGNIHRIAEIVKLIDIPVTAETAKLVTAGKRESQQMPPPGPARHGGVKGPGFQRPEPPTPPTPPKLDK